MPGRKLIGMSAKPKRQRAVGVIALNVATVLAPGKFLWTVTLKWKTLSKRDYGADSALSAARVLRSDLWAVTKAQPLISTNILMPVCAVLFSRALRHWKKPSMLARKCCPW